MSGGTIDKAKGRAKEAAGALTGDRQVNDPRTQPGLPSTRGVVSTRA